MRAYHLTIDAKGPQLSLRDTPEPVPQANELLVKVAASSLNRGEFIRGSRVTPVNSNDAAKPCGMEAAGVVTGVGPGVTDFAVGTRVMGRAKAGFADFTTIDAREAIRVPDSLSWDDAGAIPIVFLVSYDMVVAGGHLTAGEWLLVTGASSGVGVASVQIAKALGAQTIGTSGSAAKLDSLRAAGLDHGIATRGPDFAAKVRELTAKHGADLVINNVGGTVFAECVRAMAYMGRFATVGYLDRTMQAEIDIEALHTQRLHLFGVSNKLRTAAQRAQTVAGFTRDILPLIVAGKIKPVVDRVYPFADLPSAVERMRADSQVGKIVIRW